MRRVVPGLALLAAGTLLAACDAGGPAAPAAVASPIRLSAVAPACDPSGIRAAGASSIVTTEWKSEGLPLFNSAQQATDARTRLALHYQFLDFLLRVGTGGEMQPSNPFPDPAAALYFLLASTIDCAGDPQPDQLPAVVPLIYANEITDDVERRSYEICSVWVTTREAPCFPPIRRAATLLDAGFLARPALVIIQPRQQPDLLDSFFGTLWSSAWQIEVHPIAAQANYGLAPTVPVASTAAVALCSIAHSYFDPVAQSTKHDIPHATLRVAMAPEGSTDPRSLTLLAPDAQTTILRELVCPEEPAATTRVGTRAPLGGSRLARGAWNAWQSAGTTLARWLAPQQLHAWDGGAGSGLRAFTSTFGTVVPVDLRIRLTDPKFGPLTTYTLPRGTSLTVHASQSPYGVLVRPDDCAWTSSHNRVSILESGDEHETALLTAGNSAGTSTVRAICTLTDSRLDTASVVITVVR